MPKYKWDNLILFTEQLATAAKLKLPLDKAIFAMSREALHRGWGKAQESVSENVRLGSSLADAMDNYPHYFPGMFRRLIRVGEQGGVLSAMLSSVTRYISVACDMQHRMRKCLVYPLIVWSLLLLNLLILVMFAMPKLLEIVSGLGVEISQPASLFYSIGPAVLIIAEGVLLLFAWLIIGALGSDVEGSRHTIFDKLLLYTPFLGTLHRHAKSAEVCEILGILIEGGHNGDEAVSLMKEHMKSPTAQMAIDDVDNALYAGENFTPGSYRTLVPQTTLWMIAETKEGEALGSCLRHLSEHHRRQMDNLGHIITTILEPFLLFSVALFGGLALISFYYVIFNIPNAMIRF